MEAKFEVECADLLVNSLNKMVATLRKFSLVREPYAPDMMAFLLAVTLLNLVLVSPQPNLEIKPNSKISEPKLKLNIPQWQ